MRMSHSVALAASLALAILVPASRAEAQSQNRADRRVEPVRIAPARIVQIGGTPIPVQTGAWVPYDAGAVRPQAVTGVAFDLFEFDFDVNGLILPGENPAYGASAGLATPDTRYLYRPFRRNTMVYNDMRTVPDAAGVRARRVAFAWEHTVAQGLQVFIGTTQNFVTSGDPNSPAQRGDLPGVLIDFGGVQPSVGYLWADIDLGSNPIRMPSSGNGGYIMMLRTASNTLFAASAQFAMWGAKSGNPAFPQNNREYQTLTNNNGLFVNPSDYIDTRFGTPVDPLGAMLALLYTPSAKVVPTSFLVSLGRLDSGNVASLANVDGNALRVCRFVVPNTLTPPVNVRVDVSTQALSSVSDLKIFVRARMAQSGSFGQIVELFDWTTNTWDPTDVLTTSLSRTFQNFTLQATGNPNRYIQPGTNALRARYRVRTTGPIATPNWCSEYDAFYWSLYE